ncbi:MAG: phosphatidylserine/phosphatidylglycerophosphate/cardiolipin synthase family protein [Solirubrobacterales bacterium]
MTDLEVTFLRDTAHFDAKQQPADTAAMLAQFVEAAKSSLDVAIYDFKLSGTLASRVAGAFTQAAARGVKIRIGYDANKPAAQTIAAFEANGADPAPVGTEQWLKEHFGGVARIELKPIISPGGKLMHSKYVVRDLDSDAAAVWMGSANFTDGAWTRQENNIVRLTSPTLAKAYEQDFQEMWQAGTISKAGKGDDGATAINGANVAWQFSPGEGAKIDAHLAMIIREATAKVRISSMVITSHAVLNALQAAIAKGIQIDGVYDGGEMEGIKKGWEKSAAEGHQASKEALATFNHVATHLVAKPSAKFSEDGPHDFMHNKTLVKDEELVVTGSYNFSKNAEGNAENQLTITDAPTARAYAGYIKTLIDKYS